MTKILLTGGTGRLGTELQGLISGMECPSSREMDVGDPERVMATFERYKPELVVHTAAYTDVAKAESDRERCWRVNVEGTRNVARAARLVGAKLIHISTDYVFSGEEGFYTENAVPGPVVNFYSLSKLVAEEAARAVDPHLIIRTSFRPREFQYPVAFSDVYTSQDYIDVIAPMIARVISQHRLVNSAVIHVATERKSVYELAKRRRPDVVEGSRQQSKVQLPGDVSLDTTLYRKLMDDLKAQNESSE